MKYIFILFYTLYLVLRTKRSMHMLQQNFYNNSNRYVKWIFHNKYKSYLMLDWLFIPVLLIGSFFDQEILFFMIFYFVYFLFIKRK